MKIIFMGTPAFALPSLQGLVASEHEVVAVFTQRPKPKGRGYKETLSPVHELANQHNIPVYTPSTLRTQESLQQITDITADIIVVVAYGFIIPKAVLAAKKYGCLNVHPSKLPRFRGAAPLQRTVMSGDNETAVCIMQMDEGLDTGAILMQEDFALPPRVTLAELHDKCAKLGAELLLQTLDDIDNLHPLQQSEIGVTYAHKISKEESLIDWQDSAFNIDCKIRGMNPWHGTYFVHNGENIKILTADYRLEQHQFKPGQIIDEQLSIACRDGIILPKILQRPGKKPMMLDEFLRGFKLVL